MLNVYFETYGCAANKNHEELMKGKLESSGCNITGSEYIADIIVINTCTVKKPTEDKIVNRLNELKESGYEQQLVVAGCMPMVRYDKIKDIVPQASILGTNNCKDIDRVIRKVAKGKKLELIEEKKEEKFNVPKIRKNDLINICEISQGCIGDCSYCQVKYAKGELKSYDPEKIVDDIKESLKLGCKEIWITSQDNGCYGKDIDTNLVQLLNDVTKLSGNYKLRIGMMNVDTISDYLDSLIEIYKSDKIYNFLHLPVQSGSNKVLSDMNRNYSTEKFLQTLKSFRKEISNLNFWTDVIVGYPTETEQDFEKTIQLLEEIRPHNVNISRFEPRSDTEAEKLEQLPDEIKKNRCRKMHQLVKEIKLERKKEMIGETTEVLVHEKGNGRNQWKGRNESYMNVIIQSNENLMGKFVEVEVKDAIISGLIGEIK